MLRGRVVTRVLLITGARTLATRPGAEAWARDHITRSLRHADLLIVGDADGPDAWAWDETTWLMSPTLKVRCYRTHGDDAGWITEPEQGKWQRVTRWDAGDTHPLKRNAAMVSNASSKRIAATVSVLALLDGLKVDAPGQRATRGTEHTVGLARAAGLTVREEVWR
jgi:hypothetical protein